MKLYISGILLILYNIILGQTPIVENVRFNQRTDGSLLVDIFYDVTSPNGFPLKIIIEASDNDGETWTLPCNSLTGDVGEGITPGSNKHVVWDFYADNPDTSGSKYRIAVNAFESNCGFIITKDLTLTADLHCSTYSGPAITICASNITLDIGGHTIFRDAGEGSREGILAENVDGITIKNGTIEGFNIAVTLGRSSNSKVENVTVKNLIEDDPDIAITGILIGESRNVVVQDCQFEFLDAHHKEAIINSNSDVLVNNVETHRGSVGVNFGGSRFFEPSTGSIINCKFDSSKIAGVLIQRSNSALIADNIITNGGGISADPALYGIVKGLIIERNEIHDGKGHAGIHFRGGIESMISNNIIRNNGLGISLDESRGCGPDSLEGEECFYSTSNLISNNTVLGNDLDLYHHDKALGNTWENNTFETALGVELYTADPVTAREFLSSVDSAATKVAADAKLLFVFSSIKDTTGKSIKWIYLYQSESNQCIYEFWYHNGKVIKRNYVSISFMINDGNQPIINAWIDSNEALVIADSMGGKEFRKNNEVVAYELSLTQSHWLYWQVNYIAKDNAFSVTFDATE